VKRTVIVTGGTKGLGREISLVFARGGWTVVALYSSDEVAAQQLSAELEALKAPGIAARHDVRSSDSAVWNRPEIQEAGDLALIHNACAPFDPVPMHQLKWIDFEKSISVAAQGAWACTQPLLRLMVVKRRGTIVNILSSAIAGTPPKGFAAYTVAKHALRGMTAALAAEYRARGVRIFSVSPGYMDTPLTQGWDARLREAVRANSPRLTVPSAAAQRILDLVTSMDVPAAGEDYAV